MPTEKKRIHLTIDDDTYEALGRLSHKEGQSLAAVGLRLIEQALEYQEDSHFSKIADARLKSKQRRIPHDKAWP